MSKISKDSKILCLDFVKNELIQQGCKVNLISKKGNQSPEVSVITAKNKKLIIQIKMSGNPEPCWLLNKRAETLIGDDLLYVFINLLELNSQPNFYIVPSRVVAEFCKESHLLWLSEEKRTGDKRKDSQMRKFYDHENQYLNNWHPISLN